MPVDETGLGRKKNVQRNLTKRWNDLWNAFDSQSRSNHWWSLCRRRSRKLGGICTWTKALECSQTFPEN